MTKADSEGVAFSQIELCNDNHLGTMGDCPLPANYYGYYFKLLQEYAAINEPSLQWAHANAMCPYDSL